MNSGKTKLDKIESRTAAIKQEKTEMKNSLPSPYAKYLYFLEQTHLLKFTVTKYPKIAK